MTRRIVNMGMMDGPSLVATPRWLLTLLLGIMGLMCSDRRVLAADAGGPTISKDAPGPGHAPLPPGVPKGKSSASVFFLEGAAIERPTDVKLSGPLFDLSVTRSYSSGLLRSDTGVEVDSPLGIRWVSDSRGPYLVASGADTDVVVSGSAKRCFKGGGLDPPVDYNAKLVKASQTDTKDYDRDANTTESFNVFTLTETDTDDVYIYCGFDAATTDGYRGRLVERATRQYVAENKDGALYLYNSSGYVTSIIPAEPQDTDNSVDFTYYSSGTEMGRLEKVEVKKGTTVIAKAEYTYYGNVTANTDLGSSGDLIQVKVSEKASGDTGSNFSIVRYTQYRYYRDGGSDAGEEHQLKLVLEPDAIERITSAGNASVDTPDEILAQSDSYVVANSNDINKYASRSITYYTSNADTAAIDTAFTSGSSTEDLHGKYGGSNFDESKHPFTGASNAGMVKSETINGACGSCGGSSSGGVRKDYYYIQIRGWQTSAADMPDAVAFVTVEDTVDSAGAAQYRRLIGSDYNGVALREALLADPASVNANNVWCWSTICNDSWRVIEERQPSAHKGEVTSNSELQQFLNPYDPSTDSFANDTATVSATSGVVYYYEYNANGYPTGTLVREGAGSGSRNYVEATDWGDDAPGGHVDDEPIFVRTATHRYPVKTTNRADSTRETTTYTYDFWDTADTQTKKITTTLPTVDSSQNGSGVATVTEEYFDKLGRLRWTKDGEGYVNYHSYHPTLGGVAYTMIDVNNPASPGSEITSGSSGKWIAWTVDGADSNYPTRGTELPTGLGLVTKEEFDDQARPTLTIDPRGIKHYTLYEDNRTLRFPYWDATNNRPLLPIEVTEVNEADETTATFSVDPARTAQTSGVPTGLSSGTNQSHYARWMRNFHNNVNGQLVKTLEYHVIPDSGDGTHIDNYYVTAYEYDGLGRRKTTVQTSTSSVHQLTQVEYDLLDRVIRTKRDAGSSGVDTDPSDTLGTLSTSGYATFSETQYDSGSVGDSHVTSTKSFYGTGANDFMEMNYYRTFRGFLRAVQRKNYTTVFTPHQIQDVDWLGRTIDTAQYTSTITDFSAVAADDDYVATTSSGRNEWTKTRFDDLGRVYRDERYPGTASTTHFEVNNYYDRNNQLVASGDKYAAQTEYAYDGAGRQYQTRTVTSVAAMPYSSGKFQYRYPVPTPTLSEMDDTTNDGNDGLIEFTHTVFDASGNATEEHSFELIHTDSNGIDISSTTSYIRRTMFHWYDGADRLNTTADYGSGDGTSTPATWKHTSLVSQPSELPWTDSKVYDGYVLLTKYGYNTQSGLQETVAVGVRKNGSDTTRQTTKTFYDDLGRRTFVAENWVDFAPPTTGYGGGTNNEEDRITAWLYNGLGNVAQLFAYNGSSSSDEISTYLFEDSYQADLVTNTIYPDSSDTTSSGTDQVYVEYHLDGLVKKRKGQGSTETARTIHEYTYNNRRQLELDKVTQLGTGIDNAIQSIKRTYDTLGRPENVTSYSGNDGTGTVRNDLKYEYTSTNQVYRVYQEHSGAVSTSTSPKVEFEYDTDVTSNIYSDGLRRDKVRYPIVTGDCELNTYFGGNGTLFDLLHHPYYLKLWGGDLNGDLSHTSYYEYNGRDHLVGLYTHAVIGTNLKREMYSGSDYNGFDRFGRPVKFAWKNRSSGAVLDQTDYTYDYAGNRLSRNVAASSNDTRDQLYTHDGLQRLFNYDQGTLSSGAITSSNRQRTWELDQLGNWSKLRNGLTLSSTVVEERTHNEVNELTGFTTPTDYVDPVHDAAGNMTLTTQAFRPGGSTGKADALKYDAWNRMVEYKDDDSGAVLQTNEYDGLGQRIVRVDVASNPDVTYDYYYNDEWQLLTEVKDGAAYAVYHWHAFYIDALAVRMRASDTYFFLQDANFNVTAAMDDSDNAVDERYAYSPYGEVTVLDTNFAADADGISDIGNTHFYTGRERDSETGLQLNRERFYDNHLGRWLTQDPIQYEGSTSSLYEYILSNPTNFADPTGEVWYKPWTWWNKSTPSPQTVSYTPAYKTKTLGLDARFEKEIQNILKPLQNSSTRTICAALQAAHKRAIADRRARFAEAIQIKMIALGCKNVPDTTLPW